MWHKISFRLLKQELKRGELTIMALAIILSVTAVLSLSIFSDRLQAGLTERSSEFLAADRVLSSRRDIPQEWLDKAGQMELQTAWKVVFNSMAFSGENMTLVDVKAVSDGYPLRGELEIADQPFGQGYVAGSDRLLQARLGWHHSCFRLYSSILVTPLKWVTAVLK